MSMTVDETTPLTEAERRYLLERAQHDKVVALDAKFADWEDEETDEGTGDGDPKEVDYTTWKKADLQAEITRREALDRVFTLSANPKVAELAKALADDDADGDDE